MLDITYSTLTAAVVGLWITHGYFKNRRTLPVPAIGSEIPILSTLSALWIFFSQKRLVAEYYKKYPIFKIPSLTQWTVFVRSPYGEELLKAPDNTISFIEASAQMLASPYTLGTKTSWHVEVVQNPLTRHIASLFPAIYEETQDAFDTFLAPGPSGWAEVIAFPISARIVSRITNRVFLGYPLCRNEAWTDISVKYAAGLMIRAQIINSFPEFLHRFVGPFIGNYKKSVAMLVEILGPRIQATYDLPEEDRPDDCISWLIKAAPPEDNNVGGIALRLMVLNFAAIHTSSMGFTKNLYMLLSRPDYIEPLREEAITVIERYGWTKEAMGHLYKLDSFIRETQRLSPGTTEATPRIALVDFRLSNGFVIPAGTRVSTHLSAMHLDPEIYENASEFDGFRYSRLRESNPQEATRHQAVNTTNMNYLSFGHGRHACPGRFFAINEIKCMLVYLILNYEFKWADPNRPKSGYIPEDMWIAQFSTPNPTEKIMFRKRKDAGLV